MITRAQMLVACMLAVIAVGCGVLAPTWAVAGLTALATVACVSTVLLRVRLMALGAGRSRGVRVGPWKLAALNDKDLPIYTVLVPLHHKPAAVPRIAAAIRALDYPSHRLDVLMICEQDDEETIAALKAQRLGSQFRVIVARGPEPKTRAKTLDCALAHARGDLAVVFAAGDEPDPDQLKQALLVLRSAPAKVACVQAKLDCSNAERNLLTRWFAAERATSVDRVLPALQSFEAPTPLSESSTHFRMTALRELGGWDRFNVAEDAGLGVRLRRLGYRALLLESFTFEEADAHLTAWIRRRSRSIRGQIQTWLVQMRHPLRLGRELGWRGWTAFQLMTAGSAVAGLVTPICWLVMLVWLAEGVGLLEPVVPSYVFYAAACNLLVCSFGAVCGTGADAGGRGLLERAQHVLSAPLYWLLISIATWMAVVQLIGRPSHRKRPAGADATVRAADLAALGEP